MTALARLDLDKLAKVAAMFSSPYDGERAVAAALADKMVRAAGLTWDRLLHPAPTLNPPSRHNHRLSAGDILARHGDMLTEWEKRFLASIIQRPRSLTTRQSEIFEKLRARFAEAGS